MNTLIDQLRGTRDTAFARMNQIVKTATTQKRATLNPIEDDEYRRLKGEVEMLDERIADLTEAEQREEGAAGARRAWGAGVQLGREARTYRRDGEHSYFADVVMAQIRGDFDARDRLGRHKIEVELETRAMSRVDGSGGEFAPPIWLLDEYAALARAGRVMADRCRSIPLPPGTDSINIPRITTGSLTAVQTGDNASVSSQDLATATVTAPVNTIAGQVDLSMQLLDQSPVAFDQIVYGDLLADYAKRLDLQVLAGTGANGQHLGILGTGSIIAVTYTDASPTVVELYAKLADAISQLASGRFLPPESWVMHPRRWAWFLASLDSSNRPLVVPQGDGPTNAAAVSTGLSEEGPVGRLHGLPVFIDGNVPTTLGGGTEDRIILVRGSDHLLFEGPLRTRALQEVLSGTLSVRIQMWAYSAFTAARYPASSAVISGTGMVAPVF